MGDSKKRLRLSDDESPSSSNNSSNPNNNNKDNNQNNNMSSSAPVLPPASSSSSLEYSWRVFPLSASSPAPIQRRYFSVVRHVGSFYLFGGNKPSKEPTNELAVFDPAKAEVHVVKAQGHVVPGPRGGHSAVVRGGKMWVFGGIANKTSLNDLFVFDFATSTWEEILPQEGDLWPSPREFHSCVLLGNEQEMLIFGGSNGNKKYKNDLFRFNFESRKFIQVQYAAQGVPEGRAGHLAFLRNQNELVIFGGYCGDGGFTYLGDLHGLALDGDLNAAQWRPLEAKGLAVGTARPQTFCQQGNKLLFFGGYAGDQPTSLFRSLNIDNLEWVFHDIWMAMDVSAISTISTSESSKSTKPFARYGHGTGIDEEGTVYVFCGTGSTYLTDIVELTPLE